MKFSVIIPNYNHAPYLRKRIDSVLNQTFHDFEVILLDDKSSDNSREILLSYKDHTHVSHILLNEENSGSTFKQWLKGFSLAQGEYIWIAESDDYADVHFLEKAYQELSSASQPVSMLYFKSNLVDENDRLLSRHTDYAESCMGTDYVRKYMLRGNNVINASAVVFKKEFIPADREYTQYKYCGDWLFWAEIAARGRVKVMNEYYNFFRMHSHKVTPNAMRRGGNYTESMMFHKHLCELAHVSRLHIFYVQVMRCSDMLNDIYIDEAVKSAIKKQMQQTLPPGSFFLASCVNKLKAVRAALKRKH